MPFPLIWALLLRLLLFCRVVSVRLILSLVGDVSARVFCSIITAAMMDSCTRPTCRSPVGSAGGLPNSCLFSRTVDFEIPASIETLVAQLVFLNLLSQFSLGVFSFHPHCHFPLFVAEKKFKDQMKELSLQESFDLEDYAKIIQVSPSHGVCIELDGFVGVSEGGNFADLLRWGLSIRRTSSCSWQPCALSRCSDGKYENAFSAVVAPCSWPI